MKIGHCKGFESSQFKGQPVHIFFSTFLCRIKVDCNNQKSIFVDSIIKTKNDYF